MPSTGRIVNTTILFVVLILAACIPAAAQQFPQCPHIGASTGCAYLIKITDTGITVQSDPSQPPYDLSGDDTLVGVQNNSSNSIGSLPLYGGGLTIFQFDGSGICSSGITPAPPSCPYGSIGPYTAGGTGYEGPGTSFQSISTDQTTGTVVFNPPIPPGGIRYFGLEEHIYAQSTPLSINCNNAGPTQPGAYSTTCTVTGGPTLDGFGASTSPAYKWSILGGTPGLSLNTATGSTVTLSGSASPGSYSFTLVVTDNSVPTSQTAELPFAGSVSLLQGICNNLLSSGGALFGPGGQTLNTVQVNSPTGCPQWTATSPVSWVTISNGATGIGVGTVTFNVGANGGNSRTATLSIAGKSYIVNQLSGGGCLFGVTPLKFTVPVGGASNLTIGVGVLNSSCLWSAAADQGIPGLTLVPNGAVMGTGTVTFSVPPNMSGNGRTGNIVVAGQTVTVIQAGPPGTCTFTLTQPSQPFPAIGGTGTATVQAPPGCVWPATPASTVPWITIKSVGGSGTDTVTYTVVPNPLITASRTGSLTIAGQPYAVIEAGTSPFTCVASVASPPQVAIEGRTEVLGDLLVQCAGIPGGSLSTDISLTLNTNVTNAITGTNTSDAVLILNGNGPGQPGLVSGYKTIHWPNVVLTPGSFGVASVLISKVRADASLLGAAANLQSRPVTGVVSVNAKVSAPITNPMQNMATAAPALFFQQKPAAAVSGGQSIPAQFQEASPTAFQVVSATTTATRLRLVVSNIPAGVTVLAPVSPSEGATAVLYSGTDANGAGGSPVTGVSSSSIPVTNGTAMATWVVLAADPTQFDSYTFPLTFQGATAANVSQIQMAPTLGPISMVSVASPLGTEVPGRLPAVAPVPRYRDFTLPLQLVNLRTAATAPPQTVGGNLTTGSNALTSHAIAHATASNGTFTGQLMNDDPPSAPPATDVVIRGKVTGGGNIQNCSVQPPVASCTTDPNDSSTQVVNVGTLAPGAQVKVTIVVTSDPSVSIGAVVQTLFTVGGDQATADLSGSDGSAILVVGSTTAAGPPASITPTSGTPQSTAVGAPFGTALQVVVKDSNLNPVSGALVTFGAPASGASAALSGASVLTDANGLASVLATANGTPGGYNVTATVGGFTATFVLTNTQGQPNCTPSSTDLAQCKPASQSSTLPGTPSASMVVDGITDGVFADGSVTATNLENNPWWEVDLGASVPIGSIVVWNRTDCCGSRLSDYWVFVSNTPFNNSDTPATLNGNVVFSSHQTSAPNPSASITLPAGTQGRYVRVQLSSPGGYLSLAEVQVSGQVTTTTSDLALNKPASQSSTLPGTPAASVVVDGNTDGSFGDGSVTATNLENNPWWEVDLGSSAPISSIAVWNRTDCCGSRLTDYWVFVSNTPFNNSDTPATLAGNVVFSSHQTTAPNPSTFINLPGGTQGRYVRVQLTSPGYLSLAEVQVMGTGSTTNSDLALNKPASQSSTLPGTPAPSVVVDGITDGSFGDGSVTATNLENNPWWEVDLGASVPISSIVVWNRTDCCGSRLSDYWVFVSNTPFNNSDTPATLAGNVAFNSHQTTAPNPSTNITMPAGLQGRYVRVQLTSPGYLSLAEVQVLGSGGSSTNSDIALNKPASQSSTLSGTPAPSVVVDGITDGAFGDGSVTATANVESNPWWEVDLGSSAAISSITVWNRTDCCGSRLSDYWVFVSNTPFSNTDTPGTLSGNVAFSSHQTTAPNPSTSISLPAGIQGRYVRVQLSFAGYLSLAEVQVFGTGGGGSPTKAASQSSTLPGTPPASAAIDGNTDGVFADGSVTATNNDVNAWWQVDLGATTTVNTVTVWNRTDCCGSRLSNYYVFVSNTPFGTNDTPTTLLVRPGTFNVFQAGPPSPSAGIPFGGVQGRYVRVQLTGQNYLSLAEVQVQ